jgi:hypothetical protein
MSDETTKSISNFADDSVNGADIKGGFAASTGGTEHVLSPVEGPNNGLDPNLRLRGDSISHPIDSNPVGGDSQSTAGESTTFVD